MLSNISYTAPVNSALPVSKSAPLSSSPQQTFGAANALVTGASSEALGLLSSRSSKVFEDTFKAVAQDPAAQAVKGIVEGIEAHFFSSETKTAEELTQLLIKKLEVAPNDIAALDVARTIDVKATGVPTSANRLDSIA